MAISSLFTSTSRRNASKEASAQSVVDAPFKSDAESVADMEESRDDFDVMDHIFISFGSAVDDATTVFSDYYGPGSFDETITMRDDMQTIIEADLDEDDGKGKMFGRSKKKERFRSTSVKGSPATLAKEIKKFEKLERKVEKAEKRITKAEQKIYRSEQKQLKARRKIKALSEKFELRGIVNYIDGDEKADVGDVLLDGAEDDAGDDDATYATRLAESIGQAATDAIFPVLTE